MNDPRPILRWTQQTVEHTRNTKGEGVNNCSALLFNFFISSTKINYSLMKNMIINIKASRTYTINKKYTKIFMWNPKKGENHEIIFLY